MSFTHGELLRALIAAQVAVFEHSNEDVNEHEAIDALDTCVKEVVRLVKQLRKEE